MTHLQWQMSSKIGPLFLVANPEGLTGIFWQKTSAPMMTSFAQKEEAAKILSKTVAQLEEYFEGKRKVFDIPLVYHQGTPFQKKVWQALCDIPYGETCSYKDIAQRIHHDKAVRAVGSANGKNPFSIIVPCHRVIASDGSLGGYGGGLPVKTALLAIEQNKS